MPHERGLVIKRKSSLCIRRNPASMVVTKTKVVNRLDVVLPCGMLLPASGRRCIAPRHKAAVLAVAQKVLRVGMSQLRRKNQHRKGLLVVLYDSTRIEEVVVLAFCKRGSGHWDLLT